MLQPREKPKGYLAAMLGEVTGAVPTLVLGIPLASVVTHQLGEMGEMGKMECFCPETVKHLCFR